MSRLRILVAHNAYRQRGGEDSVVEDEINLLRNNGHEVETLLRENSLISTRLRAARDTLWSPSVRDEVAKSVKSFRPDLIHSHNTFPLISPSLYWAAAAHRIPVVQTLHNFRLICPQGLLMRNNKVCEDCVGRNPWRGVVRRCYRNSWLESGAVASMLTAHRAAGTYDKKVSAYVALNRFCRDVFVRGGLPEDRIFIKPNFVPDPGTSSEQRSGFLFVGRLSEEKGIRVLATALNLVPEATCDIAGEGPEYAEVEGRENIQSLGWQSPGHVNQLMQRRIALIMPSIWYENFPRTLVEAFSNGLPVIASRLGSMRTLVEHGRTGLLFTPNDPGDLAAQISWAQSNPESMKRLGAAAREEYLSKYTPARNLESLLDIYGEVMRRNTKVNG